MSVSTVDTKPTFSQSVRFKVMRLSAFAVSVLRTMGLT